MHHSRHQILRHARQLFQIHGPALTRNEFIRITEISRDSIQKHFQSWLNLKQLIGQPPEPVTRKVSESRAAPAMLAEAKRLAKKHGQRLSLNLFNRETGISPSCVYREFGSWTALRIKAGLAPLNRTDYVVRGEQILCDMIRVEMITRRRITSTAYSAFGRLSLQTVIRRYGSWTIARNKLKAFWQDVKQKRPERNDRIDYLIEQTTPLLRPSNFSIDQ
jgi:hypothetical protein